jgi:alpha-D-ribose 1-methylphosphonate 5-phosphate C-P lyase
MAMTVTLDNPDKIPLRGDYWLVFGTFTFDTASYTTGGWALTAAQLGGDSIVKIVAGKSSVDTNFARYNASTGKVQLFRDVATGPIAEHTAAATTAQTVEFIAVVRKAA